MSVIIKDHHGFLYKESPDKIQEGDHFIWHGNDLKTVFTADSISDNIAEDFGHNRYFNLNDCTRLVMIGEENG